MLSSTKASDIKTEGIQVIADPCYHLDHSEPEKGKYLFCYDITIKNHSNKPVQLLSREWMIINSNGEEREIRGEGVIGMTPVINPDETFNYSSFCILDTPFGTMEGYYIMSIDGGDLEKIPIGRFYLSTN